MLLTNGELKRSKGRFALLTAGAGLLVFVLLFQQLLLGAVLDGLSSAAGNQSGEILVFATQARRNLAGSLVTPMQLKAIAAVPGVADAAELGVTILATRGNLVKPGGKTTDASVLGYRTDRAGAPTNVVKGRLPQTGTEILASEEDAYGRYDLGGTITIEPGASVMTIVGLTAHSRYNVSPTLWIPWSGYSDVLKAANPDAKIVLPSVAAVKVAPGATVSTVMTGIAALADLDPVTREEAAGNAPGAAAVQVAFSVVMGLGYLVVGFVIGFFFLTLTLQKASSITLLRAIGAPQRYLVRSLFEEVLLVTVGGLAFGLVLMMATLPLVRTGVPVTASPSAVISCSAISLGVALLGALAPMRRILRTDPFGVVGRPSLGGLA